MSHLGRMLRAMRIRLVIDLDLDEGRRLGTRYGRAERVARAVAAFTGRIGPVQRVRSFEVRQPADDTHPETTLMVFDGSEALPLYLPPARQP